MRLDRPRSRFYLNVPQNEDDMRSEITLSEDERREMLRHQKSVRNDLMFSSAPNLTKPTERDEDEKSQEDIFLIRESPWRLTHRLLSMELCFSRRSWFRRI